MERGASADLQIFLALSLGAGTDLTWLSDYEQVAITAVANMNWRKSIGF